MKYQKISIFILFLFSIHLCDAQSMENEPSFNEIKEFYEVLNSNKSSDVVLKWMSNSKFHLTKELLEADKGYKITIASILQNEWFKTTVSRLKFEVTKDNFIQVTGELSARKIIECEYVSSTFQHIWRLKNLNESTDLTINKQ